jgi:hypothetical protein
MSDDKGREFARATRVMGPAWVSDVSAVDLPMASIKLPAYRSRKGLVYCIV